MPSEIDYDELAESNSQCSYFSFCSLSDVVEAADNDSATGQLLALGVDGATISRYRSLSNAEQHFYPSSLAFEIVCTTEGGFARIANLGLQRKVDSICVVFVFLYGIVHWSLIKKQYCNTYVLPIVHMYYVQCLGPPRAAILRPHSFG